MPHFREEQLIIIRMRSDFARQNDSSILTVAFRLLLRRIMMQPNYSAIHRATEQQGRDYLIKLHNQTSWNWAANVCRQVMALALTGFVAKNSILVILYIWMYRKHRPCRLVYCRSQLEVTVVSFDRKSEIRTLPYLEYIPKVHALLLFCPTELR